MCKCSSCNNEVNENEVLCEECKPKFEEFKKYDKIRQEAIYEMFENISDMVETLEKENSPYIPDCYQLFRKIENWIESYNLPIK